MFWYVVTYVVGLLVVWLVGLGCLGCCVTGWFVCFVVVLIWWVCSLLFGCSFGLTCVTCFCGWLFGLFGW